MIRLRLNKIARDAETDKVVKKESIFSNPITRKNLIAASTIWSSVGFICYLVWFYSKYFSGDFYINYGVVGISDMITMTMMIVLTKIFK